MESLTLLFCVLGLFITMLMIPMVASIRVVPEDKRLSVYRLGRYIGEKGPGLVLLIPFIDRGITKDLGAQEKTPGQRLVGVLGETRTTVYHDGKVLLANSEEWDAMSQTPLSAGQRVRVVRMILEVEAELVPVVTGIGG
jgi:membrane-bound ClpP family serine protease